MSEFTTSLRASGASDAAEPGRAGMVALVGRANSGKSTLLNRFLGEKVSIVSPVAQTTRNLIRGILTEPRGQIVFLDTPGVHKAESDLGRIMNRIARKSVEGVDAVLLVLDTSTAPRIEDDGWMRRLAREPELPVIAALNKTDRPGSDAQPYRDLWVSIAGETAADRPAWRPVSALDGTGADALLETLWTLMPEGPLLFPEDVLTDFPRKLAVADAIREKYFEVLEQELPHSIAVWVEQIDETEGGGWDVSATVYVQRHSQKGIVIGNKGRLLRRVHRAASRDLSAIYERDVRVHLWVKVEKDWSRNYWLLKKLGYEG